MMTDDNDGLGTDREEDPTRQRHPRSVVIYYNKGETYFSKPHLIARRMNGRIVPLPSSVQIQTSCIWCCQREREVHLPLLAQRQTSCIWCCQRDHLDPGQKHSRHGQKTTWVRSTCDIPLCKVPRYNRQSCFHLFLQSETLLCGGTRHTSVKMLPEQPMGPSITSRGCRWA